MKFTYKIVLFSIATLVGAVMMLPTQFGAQAGDQNSKLEIRHLTKPLDVNIGTPPSAPAPRFAGQEVPVQEQVYLAATPDQVPTINCGDRVMGSITQNDPRLNDGRPFDQYNLTTQQPNQPFVITVQANFNVNSNLFFFNQQQNQFVPLYGAFANQLNPQTPAQAQYSGTLVTAGTYALIVFADTQQATGNYTLTYECRSCGQQQGGDCATGGTIQNPVPIQLNQRLDCQLTMNDERLTVQNQTYYGKFFAFQSSGGQFSINVTSTAFTPALLIVDPPGEQPGIYVLSDQIPASVQFPAGRLVIGVTSNLNQPPRTGAFTIEITGGGTPPPTGGDCSMGGRLETPVSIQLNQELTCQLTANDTPLNSGGQTFYGKFFRFQTQGGTITVNVSSTAFNPTLLIVDPPGQQPGIYTLSGPVQLPAGQYVIGVTSRIPDQPQRTGQFTIRITGS